MWIFAQYPFTSSIWVLFEVRSLEFCYQNCCPKPCVWTFVSSLFLFSVVDILNHREMRFPAKIHFFRFFIWSFRLKYVTLSWRWSLSYRNQSIALLCKFVLQINDWFLYDNGPCHERLKTDRMLLIIPKWLQNWPRKSFIVFFEKLSQNLWLEMC